MTDIIESSTPASGGDTLLVRGAIKRRDGKPVSGAIVKAFDQDLRTQQLLGETKTDMGGNYQIGYTRKNFSRAEKSSADLMIRVYTADGAVLAESPISFNARATEIIDFIIADPRSEYQRLAETILPLLAGQGISMTDLTEDETPRDISFLSGETGEKYHHIELFVRAEKLSLEAESLSQPGGTASKTTKPPQQRYLGAEIFYGLIRQKMPTDLPALAARGPQAHQRALAAAMQDNIIAAHPAEETDRILKRLQALQVEQPTFLVKPEVLFSRLADLGGLSQEQTGFITARLNERLRQEILKAVGTPDESLSSAVQAAATRIDYRQFKDTNLSQLIREEILADLRKNTNLASAIAEVDKRLASKTSPRVKDLLLLVNPLDRHPFFADDLRRAKAVEYARLAKLDDRATKKLVESNLQPRDIKEGTLLELVKEGVLTENQKADLLLALDLGRLTGDNFALVVKVKQPDLKSMVFFASWQKSDWQALIESESVPLPPGETPESYADNIFFNIELNYPSQVLVSRLRSPQPGKTLESLNSLNRLLVHNERLIDGRRPAALDWSGIGSDERQTLEKGLRDLTSFANTYRHLGMANLINNKTLDLTKKKNAIEARLNLLDTFFDDNPDLDLRFVSLTHKNSDDLNWKRVPDKERPPVKKQLMAWQRVLWLGENTVSRQLLMSKGYDSAFTIIAKSESEFIKHINNPQPHLGLAPDDGRRMYERALDKALITSQYFGFIRDVVRGNFRNIRVSNIPSNLVNNLREMDGFDEVLGSQDYCDCKHCRSIFSPAAYFVDLMYFIDTNITQPVFDSDPNLFNSELYLNLRNRRSDLWTLSLTCENTNTLVPYLTIVNEVLETYLNAVVGDDIYARLAGECKADEDENLSFNLPFNLLLEEIRLYLGHFGITLYDVYRILDEPDSRVWRARLDLSQKEFGVITGPDPHGVLRRFGNPTELADFPVQDYSNNEGIDRRGFIKYAGISREQLDELLALDCNPDLANIDLGKLSVPGELQNFPESLKNLDNNHLDFIHRFIRLWKKTPWSITELDLILMARPAIRDDDVPADRIDEYAVLNAAKLMHIQEELKLTVEELVTLVDRLPQRLYKSLFDPDRLFADGPTFHHYALNTEDRNDREIDKKTPLLLAGLGISETDLLLLFDLLEHEMSFEANGDMTLNLERISLLYRHARLARALKLSIEDFIQIVRLRFSPGSPVITTLAQILDLLSFKDWLRASPFKVAELFFILDGEESNTVKYKMGFDTVIELVKDLQEQGNLLFGKELLAGIEGISLVDSERILAQMETDLLIITSAEGYRIDAAHYSLTQDFSSIFNIIGAGDDISAKEAQIREKLNEFHPFVASFTARANIKKELFHQLGQLVRVNLGSDEFIAALQVTFDDNGNPVNADVLAILQSLMKEFERALLAIEKLKLDSPSVKFIVENPEAFDIADLKQLSLENIQSVTLYKKYTAEGAEAEFLAQAALSHWPPEAAVLASLWQQDQSLIESLIHSLTLPAVPIQGLEYLRECLKLCLTLGINGYSLQKLATNDTYSDDLEAARDVCLGAFSVKYNEDPLRREKLEPYRDRINVIKRDALCDYIIARERGLKFKDLSDIYAYFLLDVEMSGCFRTSRVVCAISSLQLYVHRVLVNLEQSTFGGFAVLEKIPPREITCIKQEWEWRKNYRVWEANRKVFLYPENYLEPDLRDNKTPLFKELEDELLQEKITKESAEAAYKKYVSQFAELARLRIAGSYYHEDTKTYYFFGRTTQGPPQYYYRRWKDIKEWTPWEKIDLAIDSDRVSAIIHLGKLYLFWITIKSREITNISNGKQKPGGFDYEIYLNFSCQDEKGKWLPAQKLAYLIKSDPSFRKVDPNKQCYPGIFEDNIYVFWNKGIDSNNWQDIEKPQRKKLDLFLNEMVDPQWETIPAGLLIPGDYPIPRLFYTAGVLQAVALGVRSTTDLTHESELVLKDSNIRRSNELARLDATTGNTSLSVIGRKTGDVVLIYADQQYLIRKRDLLEALILGDDGVWYQPKRATHRISTSLSGELGEILFTTGLEAFLSLDTQKHTEHPVGINFVNLEELLGPYDNPSHINFTGAYGEYYRELFFHIPFLIANHLNANQKFKEARWWYERIFDPTSSEPPDDAFPNDRNWRYIVFQGRSIETMRQILTNQDCIEKYKTDPFNPHAIARLRFGANQKAIVMKYIDNLLDWGDYLFAQDTMESINEATMLYVLAADILGKRPVSLGKCNTGLDETLTYPVAKNAIEREDGSEFLLILETQSSADEAGVPWRKKAGEGGQKVGQVGRVIDYPNIIDERERIDQANKREKPKGVHKYPAIDLAAQIAPLAFCIPSNDHLRGYWDRVEDRLFKIRHCMNISGVRRMLALFAPPIDPMALVRARAAGLSLEDILGMMAAAPPLYRFSYLVEKARQFTQTVQSFGNALLSALEKKDVEELTLLRSVHERNILRMTKDIKTQQLCEAQAQLQAMVETKTNVQNRIDYYQDLIDTGLTLGETTQQRSKHIGTEYKIEESALHLAASIAHLIPQAGSPFSMNFGGRELGENLTAFASAAGSTSSIAEAISDCAGMDAGFQRREQEWKQQLTLARKELDQVEQQRLAADVRVQIVEKDIEIHENHITQANELDEFYKDKFTNLGLYTYLSITLNRLYREAYNLANNMAKMAESAYRFELDDNTIFIANDNWQFDRAGLLAGEKLMLQLQKMEQAYIENNVRRPEITQTFSLALLDPSQLVQLRQTGACDFVIPEIAFEIVYPGQYKRLIKYVRITIPCVVGPYTNVGAKLTLIKGEVENADGEPLTEVQVGKNSSICASSANNDAGMFEFNFRDERYLPFEGSGAAESQWRLELPSAIRSFNYNTISDVIMHISYTAKDGNRDAAEAALAATLTDYATTNGLFRLFSLKHEFPNAFHKLLNPEAEEAQETEFSVEKHHFPHFLIDRDLTITPLTNVYLKPKKGLSISIPASVKINGNNVITWNPGDDIAMPGSIGDIDKMKGGTADLDEVSPINTWSINAGVDGLNKDNLDDILILVKYKIP